MERTKFQGVKNLVREYFKEIGECTPDEAASVLKKYVSDDYFWEGSFPLLDQHGADAVAEVFWKPIKESLSNMQRRQDVFMAGVAQDGKTWVMSMGWFMGNYDKEFLGIRRTCKMQHLQYAEYSCVENGKITHTAIFLDFLGFMQEAGVNPLRYSTGSYFCYPGPRDHNGLMFEDAPYEKAEQSKAVVEAMVQDLFSINDGNEAPRELLYKTWNDDMIWYGPCGIGASFTIPRYQKQHQVPFRSQLDDKSSNELYSYFAEGDFVCFFSSMEVRGTGGWLGMPGNEKAAHLRGDIDIYYIKNGKISENWCFIDLPYWLNEQGYNVFERTQQIVNPQI